MTTIDSSRFQFHSTPLAGVWEIHRKPIRDTRGLFSRFFCQEEFSRLGVDILPTQMNFSRSEQAGTVRGIHFQYLPNAETKIVTCLHGRIFDVAVDLRHDSPTFLRWFGITLCADKQNSLVIPPGVAHGFQALAEQSDILYLVTAAYDSSLEDGLNPFDPTINIEWPLAPSVVSERDNQRPYIDARTYVGMTASGARR